MSTHEVELVRRVKVKRDMTAFRDLVLAHQRRIYYLIRKIVRRHEDTEDLLQETFIKSLRFIDSIKDEKRFGSWLSSIAVNLALDYYNRRMRQGSISLDNELPPEIISDRLIDSESEKKPLKHLHNNELKQRLDASIGNLPERYRTAFTLFHVHEMNAQEISAIMECPVNTVRTFIFRGIRMLRKDLKEYYQTYRENNR